MTSSVFTRPGLYRFRPPADPAVAWCELDESSDVAIFATEADARSGGKPLIRVSREWFGDIVAERISNPIRGLPKWKRTLARLDERGATYSKLLTGPGLYLIEWYEPGYPTPDGSPWQWIIYPGQRGHGGKIGLRHIARRARRRVAS